jgi:hypothetical protein
VVKRLGPAILIVGLLSGPSAVMAGGASIGFPPQISFRFNGHFSPVKLPKGQRVGVGVRVDVKVRMEDGSHPPALRELILELDKNIAIDPIGLPTCLRRVLADDTSRGAELDCHDALVGRGQVEFEIASPEQAPFPAPSEVLAFNAGRTDGEDHLLLHAYLAAPVSAAVVVPVEVHKMSRGRFGVEAVAKVPKVAGGNGSITSLSLSLRRKFTYKGKQRSYLLAKCPDSRLVARGTGIFSDGSRLAGSLVRACMSTS